ncbi:MAG: PAS-domain containing protein [Alphaproteobacteria bacterium]|nr:PAS-domain containing protein [Alphaproteobacteria bacterium]
MDEGEQARLRALHALGILDTGPEAAFDHIAQLAAAMLGTPMAFVSLIDAERQWFKARIGTDIAQTERRHAFCDHAIRERDILVIPDAREDPRFAGNPYVTGEPHVRFYAGAPVQSAEGHRLGSVCVVDNRPHGALRPDQIAGLRALARLAEAELERRRQRREIEARNEILMSIVDNIHLGISVFDADLKLVVANAPVAAVLGQDASRFRPGDSYEDIVRHAAARGEYGPDADIEAAVALRMKLARSREPQHMIRTRPDGRTYHIRSHPLPDGGLMITYLDITDVKAREGQLAQSQKLAAIGELTGGIAHDFNNLLTAVIGAAEHIEEELGTDHTLRPTLDVALSAATKAAALTGQLLAFARKQNLAPQTLEAGAAVAEVGRLLRPTMGGRIGIVVQPGIEKLWVRADPTQLSTALINLAVNARDAMEDGGTISLGARALHLRVRDQPPVPGMAPGAWVAIEVGDTGVGMAPEVAQRAFEPFFTTKDVGKGTGLGLSMVYGFMSQSGGHVGLQSVEGRGTTVTLYFAAAEADSGG